MLAEVPLEAIFVQVRFQAEYFLCNFLVLPLDSFKLSLSLIKVQALCFELDIGNRVAFAKSPSRQIHWSFFSSRNFDKFLQQFLVVSLDLGLLSCKRRMKDDELTAKNRKKS